MNSKMMMMMMMMYVAHSCLTLCDPMDSSLPSSSIYGVFQARVLEHVTISFSNLRCLLLKRKTSQMVIIPSVVSRAAAWASLTAYENTESQASAQASYIGACILTKALSD